MIPFSSFFILFFITGRFIYLIVVVRIMQPGCDPPDHGGWSARGEVVPVRTLEVVLDTVRARYRESRVSRSCGPGGYAVHVQFYCTNAASSGTWEIHALLEDVGLGHLPVKRSGLVVVIPIPLLE